MPHHEREWRDDSGLQLPGGGGASQTHAHIATGRQKHGQPPPSTKGRLPKNLDARDRMARKLRNKKGREIYTKRKTIPEPGLARPKKRSVCVASFYGAWKRWTVNGGCGAPPQHPQALSLPESQKGDGNSIGTSRSAQWVGRLVDLLKASAVDNRQPSTKEKLPSKTGEEVWSCQRECATGSELLASGPRCGRS